MSNLITITDPNRLRHYGWKDPLPSSVTADRGWHQPYTPGVAAAVLKVRFWRELYAQ
jgi:hypothetical protein